MIARILALTVLAATAAAAPPPLTASAQMSEDAWELFNARRFEEAGRLYLRSHDTDPNPKSLYNAALSFENAGNLVEARELYLRYLDLSPSPELSSKARQSVAQVTELLRRTHGVLNLDRRPLGAVVAIDGHVRIDLPEPRAELWMPAGKHQIRVDSDGFQPFAGSVTLSVGTETALVVDLAPIVKLGRISVGSNVVGATVFLDNRIMGITPLHLDGIAPGRGALRVQHDGYEIFKADIDVTGGGLTEVNATLIERVSVEPVGAGRSSWGWAALGSGVALVAAGGLLHGFAVAAAEDAAALEPESPSYDDDFRAAESRGQAMEVSAYVGYGVGATALSLAIWLLVDPGNEETSQEVFIVPADIGGAAGLLIDVPWR